MDHFLRSRIDAGKFFPSEVLLQNDILLKFHRLYCSSIRQCVRYCDTASYCTLIHILIHMPYTSFVDTASEGARSYCPAAFPMAAFNTDVVEMIDCASCFRDDPYFSTIGCADTCSWGENQACLLWLLIPHPQFRIK